MKLAIIKIDLAITVIVKGCSLWNFERDLIP